MGQRLIIKVKNFERTLASAYYHWSGYTASAYQLALIAIATSYNKAPTLENAIKILQATGAKLPKDELEKYVGLEFLENLGSENSEVHRNEGIIKITSKGIAENDFWGEAFVTIDLDSKTVFFDVFYMLEKREINDFDQNSVIEVDPLFRYMTFEEFINSGLLQMEPEDIVLKLKGDNDQRIIVAIH